MGCGGRGGLIGKRGKSSNTYSFWLSQMVSFFPLILVKNYLTCFCTYAYHLVRAVTAEGRGLHECMIVGPVQTSSSRNKAPCHLGSLAREGGSRNLRA